MLPFYERATKYVLRSDILRVMILDKLGGVWLDIDTEVRVIKGMSERLR